MNPLARLKSLTALLALTCSLGLAGPAQAADVDHSAFDTLLQANVTGDRVNYAGFVDNAAFKGYLARIAAVDPAALPSDAARLAFWINAYNAATISGVVAHWPKITSVSSVKPDFGFFKGKDYRVAGRMVALNEIENEIIRPQFKDPRIHAALNCASVSCPPLAPHAFTATNLQAQLDGVVRAWVNDDRRNRINAEGAAVSKIFEWYAADFAAAGGPKAWLSKYASETRRAHLAAAKQLTYLEYNWSLNAVKR